MAAQQRAIGHHRLRGGEVGIGDQAIGGQRSVRACHTVADKERGVFLQAGDQIQMRRLDVKYSGRDTG